MPKNSTTLNLSHTPVDGHGRCNSNQSLVEGLHRLSAAPSTHCDLRTLFSIRRNYSFIFVLTWSARLRVVTNFARTRDSTCCACAPLQTTAVNIQVCGDRASAITLKFSATKTHPNIKLYIIIASCQA